MSVKGVIGLTVRDHIKALLLYEPPSFAMDTKIPAQHRALVLTEVGQPLAVELRPTPAPGPGSVVVRILSVSIRANAPEVWQNPASGHNIPTPFVPGFIAIGRVAAAGPDAAKVIPGSLVFFDPYILSREESSSNYVSGFMELQDDSSRALSRGEWRNSTLAEYAKLPLENCHVLDEQRLMGHPDAGGLGYTLEDLSHIFSMLIPYGGLADIDVKAGQTIIIAPATGRYGSAAVHVALAMGARVIAVGRNQTILSDLDSLNPRITGVAMTGDLEADKTALRAAVPAGGADGFWDMSPFAASNSTHFRSSMEALKRGGRISLIGAAFGGMSFDYADIVMRRLTVRGTWMCTREQTVQLLTMVESGVLPLGKKAGQGPVVSFKLDEWKQALEAAEERTGPGEIVINP
jgi:D-arabinose 1-dehydrogenase-like Zn-dependent alcohol dehydrogenase